MVRGTRETEPLEGVTKFWIPTVSPTEAIRMLRKIGRTGRDIALPRELKERGLLDMARSEVCGTPHRKWTHRQIPLSALFYQYPELKDHFPKLAELAESVEKERDKTFGLF